MWKNKNDFWRQKTGYTLPNFSPKYTTKSTRYIHTSHTKPQWVKKVSEEGWVKKGDFKRPTSTIRHASGAFRPGADMLGPLVPLHMAFWQMLQILARRPPDTSSMTRTPNIQRNIQHWDQNLYKTCFNHNSTHKAPTEELLVRICTKFCVDSESAVKTWSYFKKLHATSDLQVPSNWKGLTQTL